MHEIWCVCVRSTYLIQRITESEQKRSDPDDTRFVGCVVELGIEVAYKSQVRLYSCTAEQVRKKRI